MNDSIKSFIINESQKLGFDKIGFAKVASVDDKNILKNWLAQNYHANMKWMENNIEKRNDPRNLVENSKTIICLASNYYNHEYKNEDIKIARYALGDDYHLILKKTLRTLYQLIINKFPKISGRYFSDTAPIMERYWAEQAGLGWVGKNDVLITCDYGSYVFLSEIVLNIELMPDEKHKNFCGTCTNCIKDCPSNAIVKPRVIDSRKCISYLNIEKRSDFSKKESNMLENNIFGCDICQEVCPWNRFAKLTNNSHFTARADLLDKPISFWENLSEEEYQKLFSRSAVKRAKYCSLKRNIKAVWENLNGK